MDMIFGYDVKLYALIWNLLLAAFNIMAPIYKILAFNWSWVYLKSHLNPKDLNKLFPYNTDIWFDMFKIITAFIGAIYFAALKTPLDCVANTLLQ